MKTIRRRNAGQSVTEFALMMPVIMAFFFWIFQVNIYYSALNQGAWAAYAGARTHLVLGGPNDGGNSAQKTVDRIMTGRLYTNNSDGKPMVSDGEKLRGGGSTAEGIIVRMPALDTLPYVSNADNPLLTFKTEISTHLGWQEYDRQKWQSSDDREKESPSEGPHMVTDNNLKDYP